MLNGLAPESTAVGDYTATNYDNFKGCYYPLWWSFFYISKKSNTQKLCPEKNSETVVFEEWIQQRSPKVYKIELSDLIYL